MRSKTLSSRCVHQNGEVQCELFQSTTDSWYLLQLSMVTSPDATPFATAIISDITSYKRTENRLRQAETSYKSLFHSIPDTVIVLSSTGTVLKSNRPSCPRFGNSIISRSIMDIVAPPFRDPMKHFMAQRIPNKTLEIVLNDNSPQPIWFEARLSSFSFEDPDSDNLLLILRDITTTLIQREALAASELRYKAVNGG